MTSSQASGSSGTSQSASAAQEYIVRVPKVENKKYNVMKFNASLNVDFTKWSQVKMERENNLKEFKMEDDMPKFGAGSEYGRDQREEARKKKYGIISKKYNSADQPWLLKIGGKAGKKYRGIREGGVTENASYYVFTQAQDGAFEAFPIDEWYNYTPIQTYKTLNAEEAEEEFGRRDKVFNYFSIMLKKRLKIDDPGGEGEGEEKEAKKKGQKKNKKSGELKISDMDDWMNSSDDEDEDEDEEDGKKEKEEKDKNKKKVQQKKVTKKKKKKKNNESDSEAWEDSDDGDEEGREVDYISDGTSDSEEEPEVKAKDEMKGVEDEEAIRKMENSESDEDENEEKKNENGEAVKEEATTKTEKTSAKDKKEKKEAGSSSDTSAESSDSDDFDNDTSFQSAMFMQDRQKGSSSKKAQRKAKKEALAMNDGMSSRSNTPTKPVDRTGLKRPAVDGDSKESLSSAKRPRSDMPSTSSSMSSSSLDGISEDSIRRYLMRKPMTASELLQKFKSKKTGLSSDQMVNTITQILKRLNPDKQMIKGKMYLSMKQT